MKKTRKMKNRILAIPAAAAAMPVNPNKAAISAITKKIAAHFSIFPLLSGIVGSIEANREGIHQPLKIYRRRKLNHRLNHRSQVKSQSALFDSISLVTV